MSYGQSIDGFYANKLTDEYSDVSLNLYNDSSFNYFLFMEVGYGVIYINRSGKYSINNDTLILNSIIRLDTMYISDTFIVQNKELSHYDFYTLESSVFNKNPEICIQVDSSILVEFPDTRFFINYGFNDEKIVNTKNQVIFDYPTNTILSTINIRNRYYHFDIDFDSYYHSIDRDNWRVEKNLLSIKMRSELTVLKQDEFSLFARFLIADNTLILIDAIANDLWTMSYDDIAKKLYKK